MNFVAKQLRAAVGPMLRECVKQRQASPVSDDRTREAYGSLKERMAP